MFTFNGDAARQLSGYGWFLVDNGYLVAWDTPGHYMTVIYDPTATGTGTVGQVVPDGAGICMCDGVTLTAYDHAGAVLYADPVVPVSLDKTTWRAVALSQLHAATVLHLSFSARWLPPVLGLKPDGGPCALYTVTNDHGSRAVLVRQSDRPDLLGVMAETIEQGPDLPDWK